MTGSWLIVKWVVAGTAGLCVGASLITWMVEGSEFVCEKRGHFCGDCDHAFERSCEEGQGLADS
jgi:hypothetical protein